ncbi:calcium-transporting ATPase 3 [Bisporella sp. PMI_857]|nr:calcium-transporting ATPase 3 [Bisporella sp. PMI_857]
MVNTTLQIDGQTASQTQIDGQDSTQKGSQDADEPPLPRPPISRGSTTKNEEPHNINGGVSTANVSLSETQVEETLPVSWDGDTKSAHMFDAKDITAFLGVDPKLGHSTEKAVSLLEKNGPNRLEDAGKVSIGEILLRQVSNSLTIVLVIAMALSYGTLDFIEGAVISAVILLNIVLGFVQDFKAEKSMQSLLSLAAPSAVVLRNNGRLETVKAESLVVGDIVVLANGAMVPADLRLLESANLEINEASLTGESMPSAKHTESLGIGLDVAVGDRINIAFSATTVSKGRGSGVVISTGMNTQIGNVANLLRGGSQETKKVGPFLRFWRKFVSGIKSILGLVGTPMQIKLSKFAIMLFGLAILLAIIVFSANKWDLDNEVVLYGICVAVAVIPESLIAVMTLTIAVGVKAMAQGNVIVRKMASLEAIGGVTNICSDKTGTLTQGKMVVHKVWTPELGTMSISNTTNILDPENGLLSINGKDMEVSDVMAHKQFHSLLPLIDAVALCNSASVSRKSLGSTGSSEKPSSPGEWESHGDPTEVALRVLANRFHRENDVILEGHPKQAVVEHQFDSNLKRMSMAYEMGGNGQINVLAKGASEAILPTLMISENERSLLENQLETLASDGLRVLCVASKTVEAADKDILLDRPFAESGLRLLGLVALYDPPRVETLGAVQKCHQAGIQVHMLTGDHLSTAKAIARQVGILRRENVDEDVMQATDFDRLTDAEIDDMKDLPVVLARCSPTTKVRMVEALDRRHAFCVMTGDGVNDAPALKRAHVGIAMGLTGTDVAKDAADMVLTDDNFSSIVKAVEEGRRLFDNIQKFLLHLLVSNIAQVILLLISLAFKDNDGSSVFPLSPLEILWVNMITSSFLALGLGLEEAQADIMLRPPRDLKAGVFTWELIIDKMVYGTIAGVLCLVSFVIVIFGAGNGNLGQECNEEFHESCGDVFRARSTVFAVLSFLLLVTAWEVKHFSRSLFNLDPSRYTGKGAVFKALTYNRFLLWAVVAGFIITFPVIYIPTFNTVVFKHTSISWEWGVILGCLITYIALIEVWKACKRYFGIYSGKLLKHDAATIV